MLPEKLRLANGTVRVTARAPGHDFACEGAGATAVLTFAGDTLAALEAEFPLDALRAPDPLGQRELKKFLELDRAPVARARLLAPLPLEARGADHEARGTLEVTISGKPAGTVRVTLRGGATHGVAEIDATFTALGYTPPKLLFLKVKDELKIEVRGAVAAC